jgi:hypothetical protein
MTETLLQELQRFVDSVAGLEILTPQQRRRINTAATLPDAFLEAVACAIEAIPHFAEMTGLTTAEIEEIIAFSSAHLTVADELERVARVMRDTIAARRASVGQRALLFYALAKRSDDEEAIAHTERMRRRLRPRR